MLENLQHPLFKLFRFHSPTRLLFGVDSRKRVGEEASKYGESVLLVSDAFLKDIASEIKGILEDAGLNVDLYDKVKREPTLETLNDASKFAKDVDPDVIIGVGGGSTMDTAKVVSASLTNTVSIEDMVGIDNVPVKGKPLILLPTTSGTGSEVNRTAMLVVHGVKRWIMSENISAELAVVDPMLTVSCPPRVTAFTGMDALAHAIEGLMSLDGSPLVDALALEVSHLVNKYLVKAYYNGADIEARYYMSMAATLAGFILCATGAVYAHSISYTLVRYGVPHGLGTGFSLSYAMEINVPVIPEKLARVAEAFGVKEGCAREKAFKAVSIVRRIWDDLGMPCCLREMGVPEEDLEMLAKELVEKYPRKNNPRFLGFEDALKLYKAMWNGEDFLR